MGEVWDDLLEGSRALGELIGLSGIAGETKSTRRKRQRQREEAERALRGRKAPNIDDAAIRQQESDRLRRRRGVLANIFGGAGSGGAPSVATKTLLGS